MPRLWIPFPVGACRRSNQLIFLSHLNDSPPLSLLSPLSKKKSISMSSGEDKVNKKTWQLRECNVSSTSLLLGNPWSPQCQLSLSVTCSCLPGCNSSGLLVAAPTLPPWPTPGPLCVLPGMPFPQVSVRGHWADTVVLSVWLLLPVFYLTLLLSIRMQALEGEDLVLFTVVPKYPEGYSALHKCLLNKSTSSSTTMSAPDCWLFLHYPFSYYSENPRFLARHLNIWIQNYIELPFQLSLTTWLNSRTWNVRGRMCVSSRMCPYRELPWTFFHPFPRLFLGTQRWGPELHLQ